MEFLHLILGEDLQKSSLIIFNLIIIESLLSVDNAAVLATLVIDLPKEERNKALKFGIIGAYIFRGICLLLASWLVKIWWLKPLGGLYLIYLSYSYFKGKSTPESIDDDYIDKKSNWFYRIFIKSFGNFWTTVIIVEIMDLAFSIDNVFAAVAFSNNIYLICVGVFIGILAMRFVAQIFVKLLETYNFLENIAFIVIGVLGIKLTLSIFSHFSHFSFITLIIESKAADIFISIFTTLIFIIPILTSCLFNYPKKISKN